MTVPGFLDVLGKVKQGVNMRLRSVYIKNFRALREVTISFSNMTVIIGENDCGKTSVMLALQVFFEAKKLNDESDYFKKEGTHRGQALIFAIPA